ncbi:MAG: hypothetical protein ACD_55C00099G0004 [uncultured bacterium]|nr:MAG: hypothetical protein ACD_55C00099G0004 [uncultured bacterium]
MMSTTSQDIEFAPTSVMDRAGKVFFHGNRVYRAILSREDAEIYRDLLRREWINEVFSQGLVRTWVSDDMLLPGSFLTLEHEHIPFETHPAENTSYMHWLSAKTLVRVCLALSEKGFLLKDAHPWNVMFKMGSPVIIDFGSIVKSGRVSQGWLDEFRRYFAAPVWLAHTRWHRYAAEYRRQHGAGFAINAFESRLPARTIFRGLNLLSRYLDAPTEFFSRLDCWLDKHKPVTVGKEVWADYQQSGASSDHLAPDSPKQLFVLDILKGERPLKVLDFAANKGYYSVLAARLGASVVACDYEPYCVDYCLSLAQEQKLPITPALLDFSRPTPCYGIGLYGRNSYQRFRSDVVLALGLVHHVCLRQRIPVEVFCDICLEYADKGVILEYVDAADKHVASWNVPIPADYSIEGLTKFFSRKFPVLVMSQPITTDGLNRVMMYFGTRKEYDLSA